MNRKICLASERSRSRRDIVDLFRGSLDHLLSHSSGIPNHFVIDGWFDSEFHKQTSERDFVDLIAKLPLQFEPGADYLYSNPAYFLLGSIVEKITGKTYSASIHKYIFSPLSMNSSGVAVDDHAIPGVVKGYQWRDGGGYREHTAMNMKLFGAGAAIFSNAEDLHHFDLALYGDKLLTEKSKERMFNDQHSFSWRVENLSIAPSINVTIHEHDGEIEGYSSMVTRFVADKHSVILLSNVGISYFLKKQLTRDIAMVLYEQDIPYRENDTSLAVIKSIVSGEFEQTLKKLISEKSEIDEMGMTSIAYQLLWSDLGEKSLQLFSLIKDKFSDSPTAKENFLTACHHRLTKKVESRSVICNAMQQ